jgi:hypothetical protein
MFRTAKNQKQISVNSDDLFKISINLLSNYALEPHLYFILLLCYLTVKEFSRNHEHLDKNAKIELSLKYTPDLIEGLYQSHIINKITYEQIKHSYAMNEKDIKNILEAFTLISAYNNEDVIIKHTKCCLT